jgi:hypothetical protein
MVPERWNSIDTSTSTETAEIEYKVNANLTSFSLPFFIMRVLEGVLESSLNRMLVFLMLREHAQ